MKKHFLIFTKDFLKDTGNRNKFGDSLSFDMLKVDNVTDKLVGCFLNYLVTATPKGKKKNTDNDDECSADRLSKKKERQIITIKRQSHEK